MALFCIIYYICNYVQIVPQIFKLIKTKSSNDYSIWQVALEFFALLCWSIYIFTSKQQIIVYVGTIIDLILLILVDILILIYYKWNKKGK